MLRTFLALLVSVVSFIASAAPERPPQYVLLAFDGSKNNAFWDKSFKFANDNNVKFTYFVNGVYFLLDKDKGVYTEPGHNSSTSAIGWGGTDLGVLKVRMGNLVKALANDHELGSHGNGHYDGSGYNSKQWNSEFDQFTSIMQSIFKKYDPKNEPAWWQDYWANEVYGFRAPQLGVSSGLWDALNKHGFKYDTSRVDKTNYWPQIVENKNGAEGFWNFPLAGVNVIGADGKQKFKKNKKGETVPDTTLSMDYNFYMHDSKAADDSANAATYTKQMYNSYMNYFKGNYYGNRAPIHIGHHFSEWNGSAYWQAMKDFAQQVCGMPEVKCVTYKELVTFMEANKANIASYQKGDFSNGKLAAPGNGLAPITQGKLLNDEQLDELRAQAQEHAETHDEE